MGKLATNNFGDCSRSKAPRLFRPLDSLRDHAGGELLAIADTSDYRHFQPPRTLTEGRQRSVLENLIAIVDPCDAQKIAAVLIGEFGSIGRVLNAPYATLGRVIGDNVPVINLLNTAQNTLVDGLLSELPLELVSSTDQRLLDYLVATMGCRSQETLRVMFLTRSHHLIADEILASGSVNSLTAYPRNIFKRAFELSASSILIIHNHPGGNIEPSKADIDFTYKLAGLGLQLEVEIKDHIIIAGTKWFSFLRRGLL